MNLTDTEYRGLFIDQYLLSSADSMKLYDIMRLCNNDYRTHMEQQVISLSSMKQHYCLIDSLTQQKTVPDRAQSRFFYITSSSNPFCTLNSLQSEAAGYLSENAHRIMQRYPEMLQTYTDSDYQCEMIQELISRCSTQSKLVLS